LDFKVGKNWDSRTACHFTGALDGLKWQHSCIARCGPCRNILISQKIWFFHFGLLTIVRNFLNSESFPMGVGVTIIDYVEDTCRDMIQWKLVQKYFTAATHSVPHQYDIVLLSTCEAICFVEVVMSGCNKLCFINIITVKLSS